MIVVFSQGVLYGLVLAMLIGPVFFALIRTSIDKGFESGAYLAIGVSVSDSIAAATVYFGVSRFTESTDFQTLLGFAGGFMMLAFGVVPFIKSNSSKKFLPQRPVRKIKGIRFILEGMLLNLLNPMVYFFWLGVVSWLTVSQDYTSQQHLLFFVGTMITVLSTDLLKAYVANLITKYLTASVISTIDRVAGVGLMIFGIRLLYFAVYGV